MALRGEVAVFTDTNIGTHIAIPVSPNLTAAGFKRELARTHFSCFPKFGEIRVYRLMVKRKSCFYHLPETLPIKYAFQGQKGTWFLHVEVEPADGFDKPDLSQYLAEKNGDYISNGSNITESLLTNKEETELVHNCDKKSIKGNPCTKPEAELLKNGPCFKKKKRVYNFVEYRSNDNDKECPYRNEKVPDVAAKESFHFQLFRNKVNPVIDLSSPTMETSNGISPEAKSVLGVINIEGNSSNSNFVSRCCNPQSTEVTSTASESRLEKQVRAKRDDNCSNMQIYASPQFEVRTPARTLPCVLPTNLGPGSSGNKLETTAAVGKRIVIAAKNLRISGNKHRPAIACYSFTGAHALSMIRSSVFEISDND